MQRLAAGVMMFAGAALTAHGQVQQSLSVSLTVYNQTNGVVKSVRVTTKDIIRYFVGTNVPNGKLWLVMPFDPSPDPGANDNLYAFMRITGSGGLVFDTTSDYFNVYEHSSSSNATGTRTTAWDQFSFDFGGFAAEVYGTATWSRNMNGAGGLGSFHCSVSGVANVGNGEFPCTGSISGGTERPAD